MPRLRARVFVPRHRARDNSIASRGGNSSRPTGSISYYPCWGLSKKFIVNIVDSKLVQIECQLLFFDIDGRCDVFVDRLKGDAEFFSKNV